jgi:hypothetical protein
MQRSGTFCVVDPETGEQVDTWDVSANGGGGRGTDLASDGSTTVVSSREQDAVWWLGDDGSEEATADVPSPTGLAVGDGVVYATTDGSVVQVARSGGTRTIVDGGLTDPGRLAVDPTTGDLLVVDHAPEHSFDSERAPSRIKRYSAAGDLKAAYGREGGRLDGPYDPSNFLGVNDVAADGQGGFVVAEPRTGARRVARFDADGEHLQEWYGGAPFFTVVDPDPKDATRVWYNAIAEWLVLAEVDYENASWSIAETHHVEYENNDLMPPSTGGANYTLRVRYHDGERYLIGEGLPKVYHHTTDADGRPTLRPVAYAGSDEDRLARAKEVAGEELDGRLQYYWWTDRNGDGEPGADEIEFTTGTFWGGASTVAPDMGLLNGGSRETGPSIRRVDPDLPGGVPKYDFRERTVVGTTEYGDPTAETWGGRCSYQAPDGGYYTIHGSGAGGDRHGPQWPMTRAGTRHRLDRWSAEGEHRWSVGRHADQPPELEDTNPRGHFHNPAGIIGAPRDTVVVCDRIASPGLVYTDDGLYAGQFFDRRADDGLPETLYNWWRVPPKDEKMDAIINYDMEAEGNVVEHDGEVYWYGTGWNCAPIYRVTGWEDWQRDRGTVTIKGAPPHAAREGSGLQGAYFDSADADLGGSPTATRVDDRVWFAYDAGRFNGIEEWKGGVETLDGQATDFAVRWTGEVEAQLTEAFVFSVYTNGGGARLAVDGEVDGDWWDDPGEASQGSFKDAAVILQTDPIDLEAGERYPIRLDYRTTGEEPGVSLNWDSPSVERQRIPTAHLYPDS